MPPHRQTRPTSDLVRESAFNLIAAWAGTGGEPADEMLHRFSFLDLYAGSGAMALEAASRGAGPVVAVEKNRPTAMVAARNAADLDLDIEVVVSSVEAYLAGTPQVFDVVWLDPPYPVSTVQVEAIVAQVVEQGWLAADGLVVVERASRDTPVRMPAALTQTSSRRYGETTLYLASADL